MISRYRLASQNSKLFLNSSTVALGYFTETFDDYLILGDSDLEPHDKRLGHFLNSNNRVNLVKKNITLASKQLLVWPYYCSYLDKQEIPRMKLDLLITTTLFLLCLKLFFNRNVFEVLRHVIIKRSKLQNKAYKTENPLDILNFERERNCVTKLNKTVKLKYFENWKLVKDNEPFWGKCKSYN